MKVFNICRTPAFDRNWLNKNPLVAVLGFVGYALLQVITKYPDYWYRYLELLLIPFVCAAACPARSSLDVANAASAF
jgi:MFS superfamily sulfate permease-like transporter